MPSAVSDLDAEVTTVGEASPDASAILAAADLLSSHGVFGLAWLDDDLIVRATFGRLVRFVTIGRPVAEAILPLVGLEDDIRALRNSPDATLDLPGVAIMTSEAPLPRLNLLVMSAPTPAGYIVVASSLSSASGIEAELARQMRARLIAEAEVRAKSLELARANNELSLANRDLEDFASIISHDLSAPMRAMRDLTRQLEAIVVSGPADVRDEALAPVRRLGEHAARLGSMLRDLHEYSSIGRKQDAVAMVDTGALATRIVASIPRPAAFRVIVAGDWPTIATLAAPLDIVLRNLVDNAVKHHDRIDGMVEICARRVGETLRITVADDGPGIPLEHRTAAFLPFRTLPGTGKPKAAGTGMGLAFVRRTVETAGGSLELRSIPELALGTRFTLLWPVSEPP